MENVSNPGFFRMEGDIFIHSFIINTFTQYYCVPGSGWVLQKEDKIDKMCVLLDVEKGAERLEMTFLALR